MTLDQAYRAVTVAVLAIVVAAPAAYAVIDDKNQRKCQETIAKEGGKYVKQRLKELTKCADKNLKETGKCDLVKRDAKLGKAESKLRSKIEKKCGPDKLPLPSAALKVLGFPGKCPDPDSGDGFTETDLTDCIFTTHRDFVDALFALQYGANGADAVLDFETQTGDKDTAKRLQKCQKDIGKNGLKYVQTVQKEISKCRDRLNKGKTSGFLPENCGDNPIFTKPGEKIAKAESKVEKKVLKKCVDADLALLDVCDTGGGPVTTAQDAVDCILATHRNATDDPDNSGLAAPFPTDMVDLEYALGAVCGDNLVNDPLQSVIGSRKIGTPPEECDGSDDVACPGACGAPGSAFACLCTDIARERVIEHDTADLDNGWTGTSHDSTVVEGGGYVADLYDCDGPGGPDTLCTVGPSCQLAPHQPCVSDAGCPGVGNACRKRFTATGPHCNQNVQQPCTGDGDCPGLENFCRKTPHGIPLPLSSGGVAVCIVNVFSEDVTGTTDLATGDFAVRLRQDSVTHLASGTLNQPCPTCGGFCDGPSGGAGPGTRTLCTSDADCPGATTCVLDAVCAFGPNEDQPCRRVAPFGNDTLLFGTPSVDCPPSPGNDISSGGLDILFNPATTGTRTLTPSVACDAFGFGALKCIAGADTGRTCTVDSDCAGGGVGSCQPQCFCPTVGGTPAKPNDCFAACRGGTSDYQACSADSQCPGGFCQPASCRAAAGVCVSGTAVGAACGADSDCAGGGQCGDDDSSDEGFCPAGPAQGLCSFTTPKGCTTNAECRPSGSCPFCLADDSEVCVFRKKDCFPNEGITRTGMPGVPDRVGVAIYCIPDAGNSAVNNTAGLPGPGALSQPATTEVTGF